MNDNATSTAAAAPPPEAQLMQLTSGCLVAPAIYVVTKLGIPDILKDGPRSSAELAAQTGEIGRAHV